MKPKKTLLEIVKKRLPWSHGNVTNALVRDIVTYIEGGVKKNMIEKIIQAIIVAVVLYVVWVLLSMVLTFLPAIVLTLIAVILVLVFCAYLLRLFGIAI